MFWHDLILGLAVLALLFPASRRIAIDTARAVVTPIITVLFLIAMRLR